MKTYPHYEDGNGFVFLVCDEVVWYRVGRTVLLSKHGPGTKINKYFTETGHFRMVGNREVCCTLEEASERVRATGPCTVFSMKKVAKPVIYIE